MCVCVCVNISMYNYFFKVRRIHDYSFPIIDCLRTVDHVNVKLTVIMLLASQNPAVSVARSSSCCSCMQLVNEGQHREAKECQRLNRWPLLQDSSAPCSETGAKAEGRFHWTAVLYRTCPIHYQPHGPCHCPTVAVGWFRRPGSCWGTAIWTLSIFRCCLTRIASNQETMQSV